MPLNVMREMNKVFLHNENMVVMLSCLFAFDLRTSVVCGFMSSNFNSFSILANSIFS
jgi:hypothetical protein